MEESKSVPSWARMTLLLVKMKTIGRAIKRVKERVEQLDGRDEVVKMEKRMDYLEERLEKLE